MNKRKFYGLGGIIYPTIIKCKWEDRTSSLRGDFYFLPMLRYVVNGTTDKWLQFRWLIWGINFRFK